MNQDIKEKWVAALRGGEYTQGVSYLKSEADGGRDIYCCLGVLCDLAIADGLGQWAGMELLGVDLFEDDVGGAGQSFDLTKRMLDWSGLEGTQTLIEMNDEDGDSFGDIADYIENNL